MKEAPADAEEGLENRTSSSILRDDGSIGAAIVALKSTYNVDSLASAERL